MNAERLLAPYERVADAPDAIPRLRRFILDLAVRGKLVPQDSADEPASELLKAISAKRRKLAEAGIVRPAKALAEYSGSNELFDLPLGWDWTNANQVWDFENGDRSKNYPSKDQLVAEGIPFINAGHLEGGLVSMKDMNFISQAKFGQLGGGKLRRGDQLYCLRGSLGKHAIYLHEGDAAIASSLVILRPIEPDTVPFLSKYLDSDIALTMLKRFDNGTAQPNLSSANLRLYEIPLPPLAEQHRIVTKVDELMTLCDRLEAARAEREGMRDRLAAANLARLNAPDPDTFREDARFALDVLPALTARADQIKHLRQTILNLAIRGKLVPQDPNDELIIEYIHSIPDIPGKTKTLLKPLEPSECGGEIPATWSWLPLGALIRGMDAGWSPQCEPFPRASEDEWGVLKTTAVQALAFDSSQHKKLPEKLKPRPEYQAEVGDILVTRAGPKNRVGVSCVVDVPCPRLMISDKLIRFHALGELSARYIALTLNAGHTFEKIEEAKSGMAVMQMNISQDKLKAVPLPLPPVAEQHRIVAKVDALMALCDRLEASLTAADETRCRLLEALLAEALAPGDERELEAAE